MKSYFVKYGSDSQHDCCFEATVIYKPRSKEYCVCECGDLGCAQMIADLLNESEEKEMKKEDVEALAEWVREHEIKPVNDKYNVLDMLKAPFSEAYKEILRRNNSDEWIENFEAFIKERK